MTINCPYCGNAAKFVSGEVIYPHRGDLAAKQFWHCEPCDSYVGCAQNTARPLGRLANASLRKAKIAAHAAFDPIWRRAPEYKRPKARRDAYKWLVAGMGLRPADTHIGMFDEAQCARVVELCAVRSTAAMLHEFTRG